MTLPWVDAAHQLSRAVLASLRAQCWTHFCFSSSWLRRQSDWQLLCHLPSISRWHATLYTTINLRSSDRLASLSAGAYRVTNWHQWVNQLAPIWWPTGTNGLTSWHQYGDQLAPMAWPTGTNGVTNWHHGVTSWHQWGDQLAPMGWPTGTNIVTNWHQWGDQLA